MAVRPVCFHLPGCPFIFLSALLLLLLSCDARSGYLASCLAFAFSLFRRFAILCPFGSGFPRPPWFAIGGSRQRPVVPQSAVPHPPRDPPILEKRAGCYSKRIQRFLAEARRR